MPRFVLLLFLLLRGSTVSSSSCQSDRNQDHRPRVSCTSQGLTAVPDGIDNTTEVLVLAGNQLRSLSWAMYSGFTELHELDLSHNHISTLEPPGPMLQNLSVLHLSGNRLTGLGGMVFRGAPSLMEIYLDRNRIRSLHDSTFSELPILEVINLSQNELPALPARLLERVSSTGLKTFDLENNSVSLMPDHFFSSKPELPYVYLTHNPWLCGCAVGYLHSFLNDQEHNIYMHDGPNDIVPAADSVVCSGPPHLLKRAIIELEESDFCPAGSADPPLKPRGGQDPRPTSALPDLKPDLELTTHLTALEPSPDPDPILEKPFYSTQTTNAPSHTTIDARLHDSTKSWTAIETYWVTETWTVTYWVTRTWYEFWTKYITLIPYLPSEDTTEPSTWKTVTTSSEAPTTAAVTPRSQSSGPQTITFNTTPQPATDQARAQSTALDTFRTPRWVSAEAREASGRSLPWCWWLFAGFLSLCVLSALTSCFLFLWLLRNYLVVYQRLKRRAAPPRVTLRAYRRSPASQGPQDEGRSVSFLPLEQIRDARAVFRSVLFISQDQREGSVSSGAERAGDKEVFRKTLHREISAGQEVGGWMEEEERGPSARYSLILREERGLQTERRWLVGEWEVGAGGVACERPCSLIGQASAVALEDVIQL